MLAERLVAYDPVTRARLPVQKWELAAFFREHGDHAAVRIVERIPEHGGVLDPAAVDRLLIRSACEMQGLLEVLRHGERVQECLEPLLEIMTRPTRVMDVACGNGFVVRWLARHLKRDDVELMGTDPARCGEATRLAVKESLRCQFQTGNPYGYGAHILISTGELHRHTGDDLVGLLGQHETSHALAFVHFDWLYRPRGPILREPLVRYEARHCSAHAAETLTSAARTGAPSFATAFYRTSMWSRFETFIGVRRSYLDAVAPKLAPRVGPWT
ncbi:MAG: class I SAM-dependent methyltransferase [Candidatus Xenobia bacterium]